MAQLRRNIVANFAGQGWAALMQIVFIPIYIKFLGIEAYGLIGFYAMLQGLLQVLDFGLSPTMTRELARFSALPDKVNQIRSFVRTLETVYWTIGIVIGVIIYVAAPFIANYWINASSLDTSTVQQSIRLIGIIAALQWPLSFYQGGLMGLERLVLLNAIKIGNSTLFGAGAIFVLAFISPNIVTFFSWQVGMSAIQLGVVTFCLWRSLPHSATPSRFDRQVFRNIRSFATGMTGIMISGIVVSQVDKLILSKMLPLEVFGYYTLAYVVSNGLLLAILPMFNALFPRFSAIAAAGDQGELSRLYHLGTQFTASVLFPMAAILVLFSNDVLHIWTGNAITANFAAPIACFLVVGTALNGLMYPVTALQLSNGWTSIGLRINLSFVALIIPGIMMMTAWYGAVGAASVWAALNGVYVLAAVPLTHRRLLKGQARRWFSQDVGLVFLVVLSLSFVARSIVVSPLHPVSGTFLLVGVFVILFSAAIFTAPALRPVAIDFIARRVTKHN
jgi:O-antigen/teichoic acid export membrane protein